MALFVGGEAAGREPATLPKTEPQDVLSASSVYTDEYLPEYAFDGNPQTRWASRGESGRPQWLEVGTVPVEPDGSAYFEAPALRSLLFVALDENDLAVKRMQSFTTVMPGDTMGCVGCHEQRTKSPLSDSRQALAALRRSPRTIEPIAGAPDVLDFPQDIQPILDRHCLKCHDCDKRDGGVSLSGDRGPHYSLSYFALTARNQVADGRNRPISNYAPRALGRGGSPLMRNVQPSHYGVQLTGRELQFIRLWIDSGAPYPGTYAALGCGVLGGYDQNRLDRSPADWPSSLAAAQSIARRCSGCHTGPRQLPVTVVDEIVGPPWQDMSDSGQANDQPSGSPAEVFRDTADSDYQTILAAVTEAKQKLDEIKRLDMPGFRPRPEWIREMKRYGVLPPEVGETTPVDVDAVERRYWESLWYVPRQANPPGVAASNQAGDSGNPPVSAK